MVETLKPRAVSTGIRLDNSVVLPLPLRPTMPMTLAGSTPMTALSYEVMVKPCGLWPVTPSLTRPLG